MSVETDEKNQDSDNAVLIGLDLTGNGESEISIDELERLSDTANIHTVVKVIQKKNVIDAATYIGIGKLKEIKEICDQNEINIAIIDDELKGSQIREIEQILDIRVIDRTTLILDIFAMRAKSLEGRLQVELAQNKYRLPRLQGYGESLSRLGAGIGTRGPGETKLETDRRHIKRRIAHIESELDEISKRRLLTRNKRKKDGIPTVALVGYTNAGKSSLLNALCENANIYVKDQLFATLDPTIRRMNNEEKDEILIVDTVGFIRKLPHDLINAFKSTLEESMSADLLIHVIDASDKEFESQIKITEQIINELNIEQRPIIKVYNKCDLLQSTPSNNLNSNDDGEKIYVSTVTNYGIEVLKKEISKKVITAKTVTLKIPYTDGNILNILYNQYKIINIDHLEDGTLLTVRIESKNLKMFEKYIV